MAHFGIICPNAIGHINPMTSLAEALRSRQHQVTFFLCGPPPRAVQNAGFNVRGLGGDIFPSDEYEEGLKQIAAASPLTSALLSLKQFLRTTKAILRHGPDVILSEDIDTLIVDHLSIAGGTVADQLGIPFATICTGILMHPDPDVPPVIMTWQPGGHWWSVMRSRFICRIMDWVSASPLACVQRHCSEQGLPIPRKVADTWSQLLQISQQPEIFEFPRTQLPEQLKFVGPLCQPGSHTGDEFPWEWLDGRPLIYASLGTVHNQHRHIYRAILAGMAQLDVQLVLALGSREATWTEPVPENALVVGYAPQLALLDKAELVITHAGLNTTMESLARGIPLVCLPFSNDQPGVAARIEYLGAGRHINYRRITADRLVRVVKEIRENECYRIAAERIRDAISISGGAQRAAELIEGILPPEFQRDVVVNHDLRIGMTSPELMSVEAVAESSAGRLAEPRGDLSD